MRIFSKTLLAACLVATTPALAGNLVADKGQTVWQSTQCAKPQAPASFLKAHPETAGDDMNALAAQQNAYVDAIQSYMNCISTEAERDQTRVNHAIASGAQKAIADAQAEASAPMPRP